MMCALNSSDIFLISLVMVTLVVYSIIDLLLVCVSVCHALVAVQAYNIQVDGETVRVWSISLIALVTPLVHVLS